ncbi:PIG-L deacetylase family protein [Kutzneria sp. CA-103260]|uniref:PIG-L deacetylase family protein n=1 Tax=Kutzneria sp. CA-103260 TaxID=2802641 RepID=UPI001BA76F23|nr:PIG-L family deacetylase [Kutzneria sp. CA-103260]QUQ65797.1 GlcNAc-PI de-N-acetylase [Kutzneria sp. CA-103260]
MILLGVFAHPDDECTVAGGVFVRHGGQSILVSCTNGEFGDDVGGVKPGAPGHDPVRVAATRRAELDAACGRLGVSVIERLGYHDSGMPGWDAFTDQTVFSAVAVESVALRVRALVDRYRPDVVVTHNADAAHEHVDHRHAARATALAVEGLPTTLYFGATGAVRFRELMEALAHNGIHRPPADVDRRRGLELIESRITTRVALGPAVVDKRAALFEHASQLGSSLAAQLTAEQYEAVFGTETFIRVQGEWGL